MSDRGSAGKTAGVAGHVVVVTGAGSGIGAQVVRLLLLADARVVALDVDPVGLEELRDSAHKSLLTARCDITDPLGVAEAMERAVATFGQLDGLVNAAGVVVAAPFLDFEFADWDRTFRVNLWGSYLTIKCAKPHMRTSGSASIVNFSSIGGKLANPFTAPYAASKAAILSLTRSAAAALAPEIRVNCVVPGIIDTPMWGQLTRDFAAIDAPIEFSARAAQAPLNRPGRPEEVAAAVLFLLGSESRFVTGEDLNVSGGLVMH